MYSRRTVQRPYPIRGKKLIPFAMRKYMGNGVVTGKSPVRAIMESAHTSRISGGTSVADR